jgi:hypothetical protein
MAAPISWAGASARGETEIVYDDGVTRRMVWRVAGEGQRGAGSLTRCAWRWAAPHPARRFTTSEETGDREKILERNLGAPGHPPESDERIGRRPGAGESPARYRLGRPFSCACGGILRGICRPAAGRPCAFPECCKNAGLQYVTTGVRI